MEEEIKEEILDSPLIVHKKTDASYQETASEVGMQTTHIDEDSSDEPTLERHRFKKKKKKKKWPYVLIALIVIAVAVLAVLFNKGVISLHQKESTTAPRKSYTTQAENKFENTITVKGTYLFFEGQEIDGIGELEREIKYLDKGTKFVVQDENANSDFLNFEVLSLLSKYEMEYDITHIVSSGLTSVYEITTQPPQTTQPQSQEAQPEPSQAQ